MSVDVAIVGAGITGLTTALLLHQAGFRVAVVDAHEVGQGVSGFNSGHLTSMLLDLRYTTIQAHFGKKGARQAAHSQQAAISQIEDLVERYDISCGFARVPGYLYAERPEQIKTLDEEHEAARQAGIQVLRAGGTPLPFTDRIRHSLMIPDQGRLNPYQYCLGLVRTLADAGQPIFEHSRVTSISERIPLSVKTEHGCIIADHVVMATHTPIGFFPILQSKVAPYRSYIIGARLAEDIPDALFWDMEDIYHYIRLVPDDIKNGRPLIVIGGEDHAVGAVEQTEKCFERLEVYARERFNVLSIDARWSAQLFAPADGLPYIGRYGHDSNLYMATGFTGEGLTCGTVAGMIIADQIRNIPNPWSRLYDPTRFKPLASAREFISQNTQVVGHFIGDRLKKDDEVSRDEVLADLSPGEGKIVSLDGDKCALYCDEDGSVYEMSPVCTHARCMVHWNEAERSWDCPCHGGRFSATGDVINSPPTVGLDIVKIHKPSSIRYD